MTKLDRDAVAGAVRRWEPELKFLPQVDSTNRVASEWADQGAPHGSLVLTDHQTAGRGRIDRHWFSPPHTCLLMSLVLRPSLDLQDRPLINLAAGVAVCQAVERSGISVRLKWPNDVMAGSKKVAGILSESRGSAVILGVGINVNVKSFPDELSQSATSLAIESGHTFDRLTLLEVFLDGFQRAYSSLPDGLSDLYRPWCQTLGRVVRVELPGRTTEGIAVDIDRRGSLMLSNGEVLQAGDVVHVRESHQDGGVHDS